MSELKETVIIDIQVDEKDAFTDLERLKSSVINLKNEQQNLAKAYKSGNITLAKYSKEIVRVEALSKKQTAAYNELQRSVTGLKNPIKELTKAQQDLATQLKTSTDSLSIHGQSVGGLTTKLAQLASPAGIAIGLVTALGSAYANSTRGAKDLEFASNQLSTAIQLSSNAFANFFTSAKDGEGVLTKLLNLSLKFSGVGILESVGLTSVIKDSKEAAANIEKLQDLQREFINLETEKQDRLSDNLELQTKINAETTSTAEKAQLFKQIADNINKSKVDELANLDKQIALLQATFDLDKDNESVEQSLLEKKRQREQVERNLGKLLKQNSIAEDNIASAAAKTLDAKIKQAQLEADKAKKAIQGARRKAPDGTEDTPIFTDDTTASDAILAQERNQQASIDLNKQYHDEIFTQNEDANQAAELQSSFAAQSQKIIDDGVRANKIENNLMVLGAAAQATQAASNLFGKNKALASAAALINTYAAAAAALAPPPVGAGPVIGPFVAAAAILNGLASVAKINKVPGFSEGGYTGRGGKYQTAGVVHAGEVVWSQADVAAAGGPRRANSMRPTYKGYADGGVVKNDLARQAQKTQSHATQPQKVYFIEKDYFEFKQKMDFKEKLVSR